MSLLQGMMGNEFLSFFRSLVAGPFCIPAQFTQQRMPKMSGLDAVPPKRHMSWPPLTLWLSPPPSLQGSSRPPSGSMSCWKHSESSGKLLTLTVTLQQKDTAENQQRHEPRWAASGGDQIPASTVPSRGVSEQHSLLPTMTCDDLHGLLPAREAHPNPGVQSFYWRSVL